MDTYENRDDFYAAYPQHAWIRYATSAPSGVDVNFGKKYLTTVCCSEKAAQAHLVTEIPGTLVAFEHATGEVHVLNPNTTAAAASEWLKTAAASPWAQ